MADRKQSKRQARTPAPRSFTLSTPWVAVLLALLITLFFNQVVVGGKSFVAPDATAPAGFARMGEQSLYRDHVYPLWNPFVFLGMPSFASGAYNPLIYPPDWPLVLLQKVLPLPQLTWMLVYYVFAGFFFFLLAREWGARPEGALLGAAAFIFAPNLIAVGSHGHGSQLVDSAYLPLMLWLAARWLGRGGLHHLGWLALAGGFQLLRGHVQICFYTWFAVALYGLTVWLAALKSPSELGARSARLLGIGVAAALAFGLAGFYNLPLRDYARYSIRGGGEGGGVGMNYATQWSLAPYELPSIAVPGWVGFGGSTYWGSMPFTDYPNAYVGLITVLLLVPAFLKNGAPRVFALTIALSSLLVSFGKHFPLYGFLYHHLPLFNKFRVPVMVIVLFQVASSLGLAWGWSSILERKGEGTASEAALGRLLKGAGALLGLVLVLGVLGQDAWRASYVALATARKSTAAQPFSGELAAFAYRGFIVDLGRVSLLGILALGCAWLALRGKLSAALASAVVLALILIELWPVSGRVMLPVLGEPSQLSLDAGRDDVVEFLEKAGPIGSFRILPVQEIQSNRYAGFGIASLGGMHAAKPRLFQDFQDADLITNLGWMRLLDIRYVVLGQKLDKPPLYLREVFSGSAVVYENLLALPRVTLLDKYRVVKPAKAILDSVKNGTSESGEVTFLEEDPGLKLGPVEGATARVVSYRLNDVTMDVESKGPALVRLADLWYPDWGAWVDGRPVRILKADYLLRAVPVPAGRHRVEFRFRSPAQRRGLMVSLASLALTLCVFGAGWLERARKAPGPAEPAGAGA